jgi:hypothetical protein
MNIPLRRLALLAIQAGCVTLLSFAAAAQTMKYAVTPAGCEFHPGNSNNTYPFYGASAHYQQIHDATDMAALNGGSVMIMTHIGFRPAATYAIAARQWDVQISLSSTSVNASAASTTFSANVTSTPTVVLPYTTLNAPAGQGVGSAVPNPILWSFPFKTIYFYTPTPGNNLLWEWQSKNATSTSTPMDACSGTTSPAPRTGPNVGTGCTATGMSSPAQAQATISGSTASLALANGAASAKALLLVGAQRNTLAGPWCSSLQVNPLAAVAGTTDSTGAWKALSTSSLPTGFYWEAFCQFAFADKGLSGGFGLSDMATFAGAGNVGKYVTRVYSLSSTSQGYENNTSGSMSKSFGLVTMFTIK